MASSVGGVSPRNSIQLIPEHAASTKLALHRELWKLIWHYLPVQARLSWGSTAKAMRGDPEIWELFLTRCYPGIYARHHAEVPEWQLSSLFSQIKKEIASIGPHISQGKCTIRTLDWIQGNPIAKYVFEEKIYTCFCNGAIKVWDLIQKKELYTLCEGDETVHWTRSDVALIASERFLILSQKQLAAERKMLMIWDLEERGKSPSLLIDCAAHQLLNDHLYYVTVQNLIQVLDLKTLEEKVCFAFPQEKSQPGYNFQFFVGPGQVLYLFMGGEIIEWDLRLGKELSCFPHKLPAEARIEWYEGGRFLRLVADGKYLCLYPDSLDRNDWIYFCDLRRESKQWHCTEWNVPAADCEMAEGGFFYRSRNRLVNFYSFETQKTYSWPLGTDVEIDYFWIEPEPRSIQCRWDGYERFCLPYSQSSISVRDFSFSCQASHPEETLNQSLEVIKAMQHAENEEAWKELFQKLHPDFQAEWESAAYLDPLATKRMQTHIYFQKMLHMLHREDLQIVRELLHKWIEIDPGNQERLRCCINATIRRGCPLQEEENSIDAFFHLNPGRPNLVKTPIGYQVYMIQKLQALISA